MLLGLTNSYKESQEEVGTLRIDVGFVILKRECQALVGKEAEQ